jgi:outer membrane protein assembly factor BamB
LVAGAETLLRTAEVWPQFRGPSGAGQCAASSLPLYWSETEHVTWKTPVHDLGWSSPVIWERQVWLTTATRDGKQLFAVCIDRQSGKVVHDLKVFDVERPETLDKENSYASPTPVIEAGRIYVHYGTYGTACLDTATGQKLWANRDLHCNHEWGPGACPLLWEDLLIFAMDGIDVQYVVALDKRTGQVVWQTTRSADYQGLPMRNRKAFCTPAVVEVNGRSQLVSPGANATIAYDPRTGKELWKISYRGEALVPRPLAAHGLVFVTTDYTSPQFWAIRPDGSGDVTASHVAWKVTRGMPRVPGPLVVGDLLYAVQDQGIVSAFEAASGQSVWKERVGGQYWASPIAAGGRIYLSSFEGVTTVIEAGRQYKVLARNRLAGNIKASPAAVGNSLFLRTETHLYRID